MRRAWQVALAGCLAALIAGTSARAQESSGVTIPDELTISKDPFKLTIGYADGGVSTIVKGSKTYFPRSLWDPNAKGFRSDRAFFADVAVDGNWKSKDSTDQLSVSIRPGFYMWGANGYTSTLNYFTAYLDGREKYGQLRDASNNPSNINQTILGAGADWAFLGSLVKRIAQSYGDNDTSVDPFGNGEITGRLDPTPFVYFRYYHVADTSTTLQAVPDDIKNDKFVAGFTGDLSIPRVRLGSNRFRFLWDVSETRPATGSSKKWEGYADVALALELKGFGAKPVIHYVSGQKEGFKYDRQVIVGLLWDWLKSAATKRAAASKP